MYNPNQSQMADAGLMVDSEKFYGKEHADYDPSNEDGQSFEKCEIKRSVQCKLEKKQEISSNNELISKNQISNASTTKQPLFRELFLPMLSVFSSMYGTTGIAIALYVLVQNPQYEAAFSGSIWQSVTKMASYAGSIIGMLSLGYLGDAIGRSKALVCTHMMIIFGILGTCCLGFGNPSQHVVIIGCSRFIMGIGLGGVYPLSSVMASETATTDAEEARTPRVSLTRIAYVPGMVAAPLVAWGFWEITRNPEITFRLTVGLGGLPVIVVFICSLIRCFSERYQDHMMKNQIGCWFVKLNKKHLRFLIGTGIVWFCYDATVYGIIQMQPQLNAAVFGNQATVSGVIWQTALLSAVALPAILSAYSAIGKMGLKWLQFWGMLSMFIPLVGLSAVFHFLPDASNFQFALMICFNYFLNWGAVLTVYTLPAVIFPSEARSTLCGIAAAMGKLGAVFGIVGLQAVAEYTNPSITSLLASLPALVGAILTYLTIAPVPRNLLQGTRMSLAALCKLVPSCDKLYKKDSCK